MYVAIDPLVDVIIGVFDPLQVGRLDVDPATAPVPPPPIRTLCGVSTVELSIGMFKLFSVLDLNGSGESCIYLSSNSVRGLLFVKVVNDPGAVPNGSVWWVPPARPSQRAIPKGMAIALASAAGERL